MAQYPDGKPIKKLLVNVTVGTTGYNSEDLVKTQLKIINGVADVNIPPVPFNAENVRLRVSIFYQEWKQRRLRSLKEFWRIAYVTLPVFVLNMSYQVQVKQTVLCMVMVIIEFNVIQASILEGWLFHPHGRTSRFSAKSPAPLHYRSE